MSDIKNLFDSKAKYQDYQTEQEAFETVESKENATQLVVKQNTFVPQIDYSKPSRFAFFGSAELYYSGSFDKISGYYPYDGTRAEKNAFYNSLLEVDKYIFDNLYPRRNGYISLASDGWTSRVGGLVDGYGLPTTQEYITLKGGPNTGSAGSSLADQSPNAFSDAFNYGNIYADSGSMYQKAGYPSDYGKGTQLSNLRSDFDDGVTVEFWLKTGSLTPLITTQKQVIFDMWNNVATSSMSSDYGRIRIELNSAASSPITFTVQSGSATKTSTIGAGTSATDSFGDWQHYALVFENTGSLFRTRLYVNGIFNDVVATVGTVSELNSKNMMARLGSLITSPSGSAAASGAGKLSGSMDEFRFWKAARNAKQIGENWLDQVGGGTNSDVVNATLGVYYKFNAGITGETATDSVVLDYGGRVSNGVWTNYSSNGRSIDSAMVLAGAASKEYKDPVVRTNNPSYVSLRTNLLASGSNHDLNNNSMFINYAPEWVLSEHADSGNDNLKYISHICGAYFDKLYVLTQQIPKLNHANYTTASAEPLPFAQHLPQSLGLQTPDIFVDATILENLRNRDEDSFFEGELKQTQDLIYQNLYNNLAHIFKAKGTEKAIRNVLRCFNLDDSLIRFKTYTKGTTYEIKNNLKQIIVEDASLNLNKSQNIGAVVYQSVSSSNAESTGYLSASRGTAERPYGFTTEADILFPKFNKINDSIERDFTEVSLFGTVAVAQQATSSNGTDTTFLASDSANFGVYAVRDEPYSHNVSFKLSSSIGPCPIPILTSSIFSNVYDDSEWNISVRVRPSGYPYSYLVSGSMSDTYDVIFRGVNSYLGVVQNSFEVSSSIIAASGSAFLTTPKRVYCGARRWNVTGALLQKSDVIISNIKAWAKHIDNQSLDQHVYDFDNSGISASYQSISGLDNNNNYFDIWNANTLALEWNFDSVTGSDASGNFYVQDYSSGSALLRDNYGWIGNTIGYQHSGYGYGFGASSSDVVTTRLTNTFRALTPEEAVGSDMIQILSEDDTLFEVLETVPDYVFTLEKSLYQALSEEMMNFLAGVGDFNNLVGEPVNRYRSRYKNMEKLREMFFRRVSDVATVEKFMDYYKWFDSGLSHILAQMIPASADFSPDLFNVIESHVLERPKYETKFPTLEALAEDPSGQAEGESGRSYPGHLGASPLPSSPRNTTIRIPYWKQRANRTDTEISSGDAVIDAQRETFRKVINSVPTLSSSATIITSDSQQVGYNTFQKAAFGKQYSVVIKDPVAPSALVKGGVNFPPTKKIDYTYNALRPFGPVNQDLSAYVPENVLVSFVDEFDQIPINNDPSSDPSAKVMRTVRVQHGRDYEQGIGYSNVKSTMAFPFNIVSASVGAGYNALINNSINGTNVHVNIVNLHNDVYGPDMEHPMQGPFTEYAVGGHQSRHISLNSGPTLDTYLTRPEGWLLLLGQQFNITGAIGMTGPDYPYPEANALGVEPYPLTGTLKAYLYRDFVAKSPVNIKNIQLRTGSTILGNYRQNYDVVMTNGAYANPRHFIDNQPTLPSQVVQGPTTGATSVRTLLSLPRATNAHFQFVDDYSIGYLTGTNNQTVIRGIFSAPGGMDTLTPGYQDFRAGEYSVYNALNYRNLSVKGLSQPSNVSQSQVFGSEPVQKRVYDIHGKDYGLQPLRSRHAERFFRDSLFQTSPGASYEQLPSFQKNHRNNITRLAINADETYSSSSLYDNAFVSHQIPRSTQQYAWINGNVVAGNNIYGFAPTDFFLSDSLGMREAYNWVTASDFGSFLNASGNRIFGLAQATALSSPRLPASFVPVDFIGLNTNIVHYITKSDNVVGLDPTGAGLGYVNSDFSPTLVGTRTATNAAMLNNLLLSRNGPYGFPTWQQVRNADNPILRAERSDNILSLRDTNGQGTTRYDMPPVSLRGRPIYLNIDTTGSAENVQNYTLQAEFDNERIYFNTNELNDRFDIHLDSFTTPYQQLVDITKGTRYRLNWVLYAENVFPSQRNEFLTRTSERTGYTNNFWRAARTDRNTTGANSWGARMTGYAISQSVFVLDAPFGFLTRSAPPNTVSSSLDGPIRRSYFLSGNAGELQNTYTTYYTGSQYPGTQPERANKHAVGALYSRKQTIGSPRSVINPTAFAIPETGSSVTWNNFLEGARQIEVFGGEAEWEAGTGAGIINNQNGTASFVSHPSEPWFDQYSDYKEDLQLKARGYSIVPEFRISENLRDYVRGGIYNSGKTNDFEIVGTAIRSDSSSFYRDYSNSEFLQSFKQIQSDTSLDASEIRLVCSAAIRLNPYKGFYPAQRSIQLVEQFVDSYRPMMKTVLAGNTPRDIQDPTSTSYGVNRIIASAISSPGILYNTIKSGIAVDYPVISNTQRVFPALMSSSAGRKAQNNWLMVSKLGLEGRPIEQDLTSSTWDARLPFETIMYPDKYMVGVDITDWESHPSCSFHDFGDEDRSITMTMMGTPAADLYSRMSKNFFGAVPDFFLKDSNLTRLESDVVTDDLKFAAGEVYMARIKIFRSLTGSRDYSNEMPTFTQGLPAGLTAYAPYGGRPYFLSTDTWTTGSAYYPLPQDPMRGSSISGMSETFTMYSRPTAFGAPIAGVGTASVGAYSSGSVYDSVTGHNPAFTPPYYDGEAWVDLVFRPSASVSYDLEKILSETQAVYRRFDPGMALTSSLAGGATNTVLIYDDIFSGSVSTTWTTASAAPYSGRLINKNSMQISASINLFGVENVQFVEKDKFGNELSDRNTSTGKKWIIQPKFETPMLNFNPIGTRALTSSQISMPLYASSSVPRGMWHQFGVIPDDVNTGVFMQIEDIPSEWLRYHYEVINEPSAYNNQSTNSSVRERVWNSAKSLSSLVGFDKKTPKKRLGELKESLTIKEAIVAVPYIVTAAEANTTASVTSASGKSFISIPKERFEASLTDVVGTDQGDSLETAGMSVREQIQKMQSYIMPPQFNFVNDRSVDPVVMYLFEFDYTFDKDDLSYIWQNLAPREYKKMTFQSDDVSHVLANNELLDRENLEDNENLRWMVFKVKQRSQSDYFSHVVSQAGQASNDAFLKTPPSPEDEYLQYNWPYDYVSFVELIKMDTEVLFKPGGE